MPIDNNTHKIPQHIAIISDGNRRWAHSHHIFKLYGHKKGAENYERLIEACMKLGVNYLTGWAFSTENWKRSKEEVDYLFDMLRERADYYEKLCTDNEIRFIHLGRKDRLPQDLMTRATQVEEKTKHFTRFTFSAAMDYGGQDEIIRTFQKLKDQNLEFTVENFEKNADTMLLPNVDLIIRTGGEKRLSGYMLWQSAYAELYFTDKYLPDFGPKDLEKAVKEYGNRERRYGGDSKNYK